MLALGTAFFWLALYLAAFFLYYRYYFRPRLYLLLLDEEPYLEHYLSRLPHMKNRQGDRQGMVEFLMDKRGTFIRENRIFLVAATILLLLGLAFSAS
ncbi:MAG: hypothetical protein RDU30_12140 [Desulfovibrionaceae bacterium]|nr:hypothetical protein [Desulfovibrionaceae bacterium]